MHVMMTKDQFDALGKSKGDSKSNGKEKKFPKLELKEDDETHGTIDTEDVTVDYYFNEAEGRLYFSVSKRHTLAAYCAGDNIIGTYIMDLLSSIPKPATTDKGSGTGDTGVNTGTGETQEKKASEQYQPSQ